MKYASRFILIAVLGLALIVTYRRLQEEEHAGSELQKASPEKLLIQRIRNLPDAPASWRILETAPREVNMDEMPDIRDALYDLLETAKVRVVFESHFLKRSWGKSAEQMLGLSAKGLHILGVLHPNLMNDAPFLNELRAAGAQIVERDFAPLGGHPTEGYLHSKFVVVDGRRGYIGSANLGAAGMDENREMGLYFEDDSIARTLELMASFDAGHSNAGRADKIQTAILAQGAAEEFAVEGMPLCDESIAALCAIAQKEIDIMAFTFSHQFGKYDAVVNPLRAALRRGVKVRIIHDAGQLKEIGGVLPTLRDMKQWGADVKLADFSELGKSSVGQYHAKAMRVDDEFLMMGSNNLTEAASRENRELAIVFRSQRLARDFVARFDMDWNTSGYVSLFVP